MPQREELIERDEPVVTIISNDLPSRPFSITLEVPLFLLMIGIAMSAPVMNNLLLYRTCIHTLNYSEEECKFMQDNGPQSNETIEIETNAQKYATMVSMIRSVLEAVCPAILSFFLGVWSDTYGRKPLVVWPLFGMTITTMLVVVYSLLPNFGPWWYILTVIPFSLSGGYSTLFTGAFSYVSDITSTDNRSIRLSLIEAAVFVGTIIGSIASAYLSQLIGISFMLLLTASVYVAAYAFTNIYIVESLTGALKGGMCSVLDLLLVKEMMVTCFQRRPNNGRAIILLLIFANSLSIFVLFGLANLDYLYAREKLMWTLKDYTVFTATNTAIMIFGLFLGVTCIQKLFRASDLFLSIVSFVSSIAEVIVKALAVVSWHMYMGASISTFRGLSSPLIRSLLTKILPLEDIAKVFALMCSLEAIFPVFAPFLYNVLYSYTITTFPGAIYILSASIYGSCIIMLCFVQYYLFKHGHASYTTLINTPVIN